MSQYRTIQLTISVEWPFTNPMTPLRLAQVPTSTPLFVPLPTTPPTQPGDISSTLALYSEFNVILRRHMAMPPPRAAAAAFFSLHPAAPTTIASSPGISHAHAHHRPQAHRIQLHTRLHPPIYYSQTTPFSTSTYRPATAHEPNYYEILDIPITATAGEIKKQFYALSLRHHPDRNRTDPNASQRFARISAAYNVLGKASRRASYDREHGFHHAQQSHRYGFGAGGGKKKKQETDPEDPTAFIDRNPLGHFNARGHFRTQTAEDARRRERRSRARAAAAEHLASSAGGAAGDFALRFLVVSGSLMIAGAMTGLLKWPAGSGSSGSATSPTGTGTGGKRSGSTGGRGEAVSGP
ncbi:hypothetical protein N7510_007042 [Penicillium lagena]|uniref:uncharacterized protein n=1 Tax=Penicillium lagena TaxID=94218 RepID=UPI002541B489|nr:uncharacterized protein N7510_007042 [Penicillium lagena]KAJ5610323.1 hypothetical protein N7510_007042 [Penicillium lagena]